MTYDGRSGAMSNWIDTSVLTISATTLTESGGTTLAIGAVSDGDVLTRSGTTLVSAQAPTLLPISLSDLAQRHNLLCDFLAGMGFSLPLDLLKVPTVS